MNLKKKKDNETINKGDEKPTLKKYNNSNLIYDSNQNFYKYHIIKYFYEFSFKFSF